MTEQLQKMNSSLAEEIPKVAGFIRKLYNILNTALYSKVICWNEDGKSVRILSYKDLESKVLECNFRHRNYNSFIRQLNMYGFRKMERTVVNKVCSFAHPLFERGAENNLHLIKTKHETKRLQRLVSLSSFEKNSVEKVERKQHFRKFEIHYDRDERRHSRHSSPNVFRPLRSQKQNSNRSSTKQGYQQGRTVQKQGRQKEENFYQKKESIDSTSVLKTESRQTVTKNDSREENNKISWNYENSKQHLKSCTQKNFEKPNQPNLYFENEAHFNLNTSVLSKSPGSPIRNLTFQKQSFVDEVLPFQKNSYQETGQHLEFGRPSVNMGSYPFEIQPTFYSPMMSDPRFMTMAPSYTPYFQMMQQPMVPSIPQVCMPMTYYNLYV